MFVKPSSEIAFMFYFLIIQLRLNMLYDIPEFSVQECELFVVDWFILKVYQLLKWGWEHNYENKYIRKAN